MGSHQNSVIQSLEINKGDVGIPKIGRYLGRVWRCNSDPKLTMSKAGRNIVTDMRDICLVELALRRLNCAPRRP